MLKVANHGIRLLGVVAVMALLGVSQASADETFDYVGNSFTFNSNPSVIGDHVTASVTLSCAVACSDGRYYFSFPPGNNPPSSYPYIFTLSSDPNSSNPITTFSNTSLGQNASVLNNYVTLSGGAIISWALQYTDNGSGSDITTIGNDPTYGNFDYYEYDIRYSFIGYGYNGSSNGTAEDGSSIPGPTAGIWSLDAAPGPIPGSGLLSYIALVMLGIGSAAWKRLRSSAVTA